MEVHPGIHRIEIPYQNRYLYQHILVSETKLIFIDAGVANTPREILIPYVNKYELDKNKTMYLLITHCDADHCGGASNLKKHYPNLIVMSHLYERPYIENVKMNFSYRYAEFEHLGIIRTAENYSSILKNLDRPVFVDIGLVGGEEISLAEDWTIKVVFSPGHTAGHVLVYSPKDKCAIITDAILGEGIYSIEGSLALCPTYRYTDLYLETIDKISNLNVNLLYASHFPVIEGEEQITTFVKQSKDYVFRVEKYIMEKLKKYGEVNLSLLINESENRLGPKDRKIDQYYCLQGGLEMLKSQKKIQAIKDKNNQQSWRI